MRIYNSFNELIKHKQQEQRSVVITIGFFDGVHLGHQRLLQELLRLSVSTNTDAVVVTFTEQPGKVLHPERPAPVVLSSVANKLRYMSYCGISNVVLLNFTPQLARLSAEEFIAPLLHSQLLKGIVMGYDNTFGYSPKPLNLYDFDKMIASWRVKLLRIPPLWIGHRVVSSTTIRKHITSCEFPVAERLLGRPYSFLGEVEYGQQIGRTIDYPTANITPLEPDIFLPEIGIYVSEVRIGNKVYPAMSYYGSRPTIASGQPLRLEAFLLDFTGDLYGQCVEIGFKAFLRGDKRFGSLDELAQQIQKDEIQTRAYFREHSLTLPTDPKNQLEEIMDILSGKS